MTRIKGFSPGANSAKLPKQVNDILSWSFILDKYVCLYTQQRHPGHGHQNILLSGDGPLKTLTASATGNLCSHEFLCHTLSQPIL